MEFQNPVIGGGDEIVREAIQSRGYTPGVSGWRLERNGNAFFVNGTFIGDVTITGAARSANYVAATSGWELRSNGSAEFNGNVDLLSAVVTGGIQSSNYVAGVSGWRLRNDGFAEFNGVILTGLVDGKVHVGAPVDTVNFTVGTEIAVGSANPQNTPQIFDHAYQALVTVLVGGATAGNRIRFRLWDGALGFVQLGANAPLVKMNTPTGTFEAVTLSFIWKAPTTAVISNINLGMEFFSGVTSVTVRVSTDAYNFIINDLGMASRIAGL